MIKCFIFIFIFVLNLILVFAYNPFLSDKALLAIGAESPEKGQKLFKTNCSGCHLNGQNLIKADKPLVGSIKLKTKQSFSEFISAPPPPMPNFKNIVLKPDQLDELYSYVISLMGK